MFVEWTNRWRPVFRRFAAEPPATLSEIYPGFRSNNAMLSVLLAERLAIVGCHFGLPIPDQIAALNGAGCRLWATATLVAEGQAIMECAAARAALDAGAVAVQCGPACGGNGSGDQPVTNSLAE